MVTLCVVFPGFIAGGIQNELLDEKLAQFDLARLASQKPERDLQFDYLGVYVLFDRYFRMSANSALNCHKRFLCAFIMGRHSMKPTGKTRPSSSTRFFRRSTS
jgi:hypothetical protein